MIGLFYRLSGLTSLTILLDDTEQRGSFGLCSMQDIVAWCPNLRALELVWGLIKWTPKHYTCILQLTALQNLKIFTGIVWTSLLPRLTCLTHLRALGGVSVHTQDVAALAALTQLTSLGGSMDLAEWYGCLQALTGLKRVSVKFMCGGRAIDVLGPLLQLLPTALEGLCFHHFHCGMSAKDLLVFSGMTWLDRLEIGETSRDAGVGLGIWSLEGSNPWCERLVGLRHLGLVGRPTGAPDIGVLARHLTALEHLRLRLELFDDVLHLSGLTRLHSSPPVQGDTRRGVCTGARAPQICNGSSAYAPSKPVLGDQGG